MDPDYVWYYIPDSLKGVIRVPDNWIPDSLKWIIRFPGYPGISISSTPSSGSNSLVFWFLYIFICCFLNVLVSFFYGARLSGILWHNPPGFSFPIIRICGNDFFVFCIWTNKISCILLWIFSVFPFHLQWCLPLYCPLPPVLVVVGDPFLLGKFSWMSLSSSFHIIHPIMIPCLMPWNFSWYCILQALVNFLGSLIFSVYWILVPGKNIHLICFVPLVLICRMHMNICG